MRKMEKQERKEDSSGRRGFVRRIMGLVAAGGIASVLLGGRVEKAQAADAAYDNLVVDTSNVNAGAIAPGIQFGTGGPASGEGISSKRTATGNQYGIDFYTEFTKRMSILVNGKVGIGTDNPQALLHVSGTTPNILMGDSANTIWPAVVGGTISGGGGTAGMHLVTANYGTVGGGDNNVVTNRAGTVGGGSQNQANGLCSTVSGGAGNIASGDYSTVAGGVMTHADGHYSFAAGHNGNVLSAHNGVFLFADNRPLLFNSAAVNEFAVRCTGGARLVTAIDASGYPTKMLTFSPNGYLGVGTTNPQRNIQISDPSPTIGFKETGDGKGWSFYSWGGDSWRMFEYFDAGWTTGADRFVIKRGGYVGIGTSSPTERLHVAGNVKCASVIPGDIVFENGIRATEDGDGLAFKNPAGEKIALLDSQGNLRIKGRLIEEA
jgi:hypothetical protein